MTIELAPKEGRNTGAVPATAGPTGRVPIRQAPQGPVGGYSACSPVSAHPASMRCSIARMELRESFASRR